MIHALILTLGLLISFSENPMDCGTKYAGACLSENRITIIMTAKGDINEYLYHEVGHSLFTYDQYVREFIAPYPAPRVYPIEIYDTYDKQLNEKVADYFAMYIKYTDFPDKFPEIKKLFDEKIESLNSTIINNYIK